MVVKSPSAHLSLRFDEMHPELQIARSLFVAGHYQEAIRKAAERFHNRLRELAGYQGDRSGRAMIRHVLQGRTPLLTLVLSERDSLNKDAIEGFVDLAVGMTASIRNVYTHADDWPVDQVRGLEVMALISTLHRMLDEAQPIPDP